MAKIRLASSCCCCCSSVAAVGRINSNQRGDSLITNHLSEIGGDAECVWTSTDASVGDVIHRYIYNRVEEEKGTRRGAGGGDFEGGSGLSKLKRHVDSSEKNKRAELTRIRRYSRSKLLADLIELFRSDPLCLCVAHLVITYTIKDCRPKS